MALPFTLTQFQIEGFQCIRRTGLQDISMDAPWILITGEKFRPILTKLHKAQEATQAYSRLGWHLQKEFERFFLHRLPESQRPFVAMAFERFSS